MEKQSKEDKEKLRIDKQLVAESVKCMKKSDNEEDEDNQSDDISKSNSTYKKS